MTKITIQCKPDEDIACDIRTLFCQESATNNVDCHNPLVTTNFNNLLDMIVQKAFEEGLNFKFPLTK